MADIGITEEVDELAVALVHALSRQDGEQALALALALDPLIGDRPALRARHATWTAQAHQIRGEFDQAASMIRHAIALAQAAGESDALPGLKALKADIVRGKVASKTADTLPLPDTLLGRAVSAMDQGDLERGRHASRRSPWAMPGTRCFRSWLSLGFRVRKTPPFGRPLRSPMPPMTRISSPQCLVLPVQPLSLYRKKCSS